MTRYPWTEWADGEWHKATHDTDYFCSTKVFVQSLHRFARQSWYALEHEIDWSGDHATVKFRIGAPK